jgi:hypoxanthine phosphoribosyltransferase
MYDISWREFNSLSIDLAKQITYSEKTFDAIVCVSRGGLLLGRLLSSVLELPLGVISAKKVNNKYVVDNYISTIYDLKGDILLVDDVFESSANIIKNKIKSNYKNIQNISLACIFYKKDILTFKPDFFINQIKNELDIVFPYQEKALIKDFKYALE